jgi:heavy metal translocating P-type ATPase
MIETQDFPDKPRSEHEGLPWLDLARAGLVGVAALVVWFRLWPLAPHLFVLGLAATLLGGFPIVKEAVLNLFQRKMTMELSMAIAIVAALAIRETFTALIITLFVLVAEMLEDLTVARGRRAIEDLLSYLPRTATVQRGGAVIELPLAAIVVGDCVLVSPGGRLPVDGTVVGGQSFVDEATITGESMPREKTSGDRVWAGTINQSGALQVRAERLGRDTSFGKIIEAVERAEHSRAPVQRTADRLAGYLVYFAMAAAVLTFVLTRDARSTISVIIVAGACGIAAGTPLAILGAIGRAAKQGSIIKGGLYLEALAAVDTVVFDKTGTVTTGAPEVAGVFPENGVAPSLVVEAAAIAERRSEHPLGKAILARAEGMGLTTPDPDHFAYTPGRGIVATVAGGEILAGNRGFLLEHGITALSTKAPLENKSASEVWVAWSGRLLGAIQIADTLRPGAREAVAALKAMGIRTALLTGDQEQVAGTVAREIGVDAVRAELLPDGKAAEIRRLIGEGRTVAMVGDGVNDAPALAEAHVGIAMGSGTDVTRESADVVLLGNDLLKLVETVRIARRARRIIMQNFAGTLIVDAVGIGMAAFGMLNPLLAAFIHVASELTFILNSTRLLPAAEQAVERVRVAVAGESQAA